MRALTESGGNKARLARALGVDPPRVSEWLSGKVTNTKYSKGVLAHAVLVAQGRVAPADVQPDKSLLDALEGDARRTLERIREARAQALGATIAPKPLTPPTPSQVEAAVRSVKPARKKAQ